jgi:MtN3 and saliva related transmembrane protein
MSALVMATWSALAFLQLYPALLRPNWPFIGELGLVAELRMAKCDRTTLAFLSLGLIMLCGCQDLLPHDTQSLLAPRFSRSEIIGFLAGLGTTFAAVPDLITMIKRRSSAGLNPRMAAIIGAFQILWVYYGLLIASRPVIAWNVIAVLINFLCVGAYAYLAYKEKSE